VSEHRHLTCEEVFRRLDDYLDRELDRFEASVLAGIRRKFRRIQLPPDLLGRLSRRLHEASGNAALGE
jgi:hypothetical protein